MRTILTLDRDEHEAELQSTDADFARFPAMRWVTLVISGGEVAYQVVGPPPGLIIATLPAGCKSVRVGGIAYTQCGPTYYTRVSSGYRVVVLQ